MLLNLCYTSKISYFFSDTYKKLIKIEKHFNAKRNYHCYAENTLNRITTEHISKFNNNEANDQALFESAHHIVKELLSDRKISLNSLVAEHNKEILDYNNYGSRLRRFGIFLHTYRNLASKDLQHNEHMLRASIMAYLVHTLMSSFIIMDDVLDEADLRRNKLPWYKVAGKTTILDVWSLNSGLFVVMKHFFEKEPYYVQCFELLNEVAWLISAGVSLEDMILDMITRQQKYFNIKTYREIVFGKMTSNAFYMPVVMAMHMANHNFSNYSDKLMYILDEMGYYSMLENDYCDRYGKTTGKALDDDIKTGKLTSLLLAAVEIANDSQKEVITKYYGKRDPDSVNEIINVYDELKLHEVNKAQKEEMYRKISEDINTIPDPTVQNILMHVNRLIENWYKD